MLEAVRPAQEMEGDSGLVRAQLPGIGQGLWLSPGTLHHRFILTCKTARSSGSGNIIPPQVQSSQERIWEAEGTIPLHGIGASAGDNPSTLVK